MMFLETESDNELLKDDDEIDNNRHQKLIKKLSRKYSSSKEHQWKSNRFEAEPNVDINSMSKRIKHGLSTEKLLKIPKSIDSKKVIKNIKKPKVLPKPLPKPINNQIIRRVNFKEISKDFAKYDPVVKQVRHAQQLVFPAEDQKLSFGIDRDSNGQISNNSIVKNIEEQISVNLDNFEDNEKFLTENEIQILKSLDLEEARKLHQKIQRRRVLISYQEAKFRRIRKIKSKKYHRLLKKSKLKKSLEEFDQAIEKNTDKATETLEELDRLRALERASLKHSNSGKWAKHNKIRAKYNEESRNKINEQLQINRIMMKKRSVSQLDEDEDDSSSDHLQKQEENITNNTEEFEIPHNYNPWITSQKMKSHFKTEVIQSTNEDSSKNLESVQKFISERVAERVQKAKKKELKKLIDEDENDEKLIIETSKNNQENDSIFNAEKSPDASPTREPLINTNDEYINLDSKNFFENIQDVKNKVDCINIPSDSEDDVDDIDFHRNEDNEKYLREAFADDDVIDEFLKEKKQNDNPEKDSKQVCLPGWGSWSGFNINESRKKMFKLKRKVLTKERKLDKKICNAIFLDSVSKELKKTNLKPHLLKPIGSTWTPRLINNTLLEPKVVTKLGTIIEPMAAVTTSD